MFNWLYSDLFHHWSKQVLKWRPFFSKWNADVLLYCWSTLTYDIHTLGCHQKMDNGWMDGLWKTGNIAGNRKSLWSMLSSWNWLKTIANFLKNSMKCSKRNWYLKSNKYFYNSTATTPAGKSIWSHKQTYTRRGNSNRIIIPGVMCINIWNATWI